MDDPPASPESFFSKHASAYVTSERHARGADLEVLLSALAPIGSERALDVATGPGHTALALAPRVREVVGIDVTEEMLAEARKLAASRGVGNVVYRPGDAMHLPFTDGSFGIVTSRRAPHHFPDIGAFVREAFRVLVDGGRLGVSDMSPPVEGAALSNRIERLRDPSHARALPEGEWTEDLLEAGFTLSFLSVTSDTLSFEDWLSPVPMGGPEERAIREALRTSTPEERWALGVRESGGEVSGWEKRRVVLVGSKTLAGPE